MNKAEQDFKEWYLETYEIPKWIPSYWAFEHLPIEFKWGVYQRYFREKGIDFVSHSRFDQITVGWAVGVGDVEKSFFMPNIEEAIYKAFELLNERE